MIFWPGQIMEFYSSNNGEDWALVPDYLTELKITSFAFSHNNIITGSDSGLYVSTNDGQTWSNIYGLIGAYITGLAVTGDTIIAGTSNRGVYISSDAGLSWRQVNKGLTVLDVPSVAINGSNVIAGIWGKGMWTCPLSTILDIKNENNNIITKFILEQNYPNPFNPDTKIRYVIPKSAVVKIKVFDLLGREAATLINGFQNSGEHETIFNATGFSSGVYIYSIYVDGVQLSTKKMLLMK